MFVVQELSQEARKKAPQTLSLNPGIFVSKNDKFVWKPDFLKNFKSSAFFIQIKSLLMRVTKKDPANLKSESGTVYP